MYISGVVDGMVSDFVNIYINREQDLEVPPT
jgi:hypothetical protein